MKKYRKSNHFSICCYISIYIFKVFVVYKFESNTAEEEYIFIKSNLKKRKVYIKDIKFDFDSPYYLQKYINASFNYLS